MSNYEKVKAWRAKNPDKVAAQAARYRAKHPDKVAQVKANYLERTRAERLPREAELARVKRAADPEGALRRRLAFEARKLRNRELEAGRPRPDTCELCAEKHARIAWDHCHVSGKFRGWICDRCNKTLGHVKDNPALLRLMATYLEKDSKNGNNQ